MAKTNDTAKKGPKGGLSKDHLDALAEGRREGRTVRSYLDALEETRPRRGRKRSVDTVKGQLATVGQDLVDATGLDRLLLLQRRVDLEAELDALESKVDIGPIEEAFVGVAASYSKRKGLSYQVWRDAGVSAAVLKRAGISRAAT